ncbi:MAG: hypothetical protein IPL49_03515 [Saprospirales bacterium]|nr:hypothetical protein [Saprospirales bacterium]MBK8489983.1 hypothetical protein [Saprospirales bacterium]
MDFQKAGILLEKIHALYKNMSADAESVSEIEKDLMRAYLRQFYEHFLPHEEAEPQQLSPPLPPERKEQRKVEVLKAVEVEVPEPPKEQPVVEKPARKAVTGGDKQDIDTLFEHHQATELSEKLSELPIQDLSKAMGLNERIFTINELFDGDQEAFKQAVQVLNGFHSFEEAKNYLVQEIAIQYNWAQTDKKNKAKNFIKLVRRRYNA